MSKEMQGSRHNRCSSSRPHLVKRVVSTAEAEPEAVAVAVVG